MKAVFFDESLVIFPALSTLTVLNLINIFNALTLIRLIKNSGVIRKNKKKVLTCPLLMKPCLAARRSAVVSPPGTLTANSLEYTGFSRRAEANGAETKRAKIPTLIQNKSTDKSFLGSTMILLDRNIVTSVINFSKIKI